MKQKRPALQLTHTSARVLKKQPHKHAHKHTQAASLHLRNVTGLLLHSKPTGALNKHLFLPVNPPAFTVLLTRLSQGTQTPCRASAVSLLLLASLALLLLFGNTPPPSTPHPESHLYTDIWNTNKETRTRRGGEDYCGLPV